ncbi:MAG: phage/plasmid primase, P4 family [Methanolobus sp.]
MDEIYREYMFDAIELYPEESKVILDHDPIEINLRELKFVINETVNNFRYHVIIDVFKNDKNIISNIVMDFNDLIKDSEARDEFRKSLGLSTGVVNNTVLENIINSVVDKLKTDQHIANNRETWRKIALKQNVPTPDENGKISIPDIANHLIEKLNLKVINLKDGRKNKLIYHYNEKKGVYENNGYDITTSEVNRILGDKSRIGLVHEVFNVIIHTPEIWFGPDDFIPDDPYIINVENGLLDTRTLELKPHIPDYHSVIQYPVIYDPNAKCPWFDRFITDVLPDETDRRDVLEFFGYTLLPGLYNCYHKSLMVLGPPGTGKGTTLDTLQQLLGEKYVSTSDLQKIETNQFQAYQLVGKVANISDDLPKENMSDCPNFKTITTGGRINVQDKGKTAFDTRIQAKLISAANTLPFAPMEGNDAYFQRFVLIKMNRVFRGTKQQIPNLIKKLTTPEEKSGILNILLEHLQTVNKNDRLSYDKSLEEIKRMYELEQNHVAAFFMECTEESSIDTPKNHVYDAYLLWCERNGVDEPKSKPAFTRAVTNAKFTLPHIKGGQSKQDRTRDMMVWFNLELKVPWNVRTNRVKALFGDDNPYEKKVPKIPKISLPPLKKGTVLDLNKAFGEGTNS